MKHLILTIVLLLISCSSTPTQEEADELRNIAMACNEREKTAEENCDREWGEWNEAEDHVIEVERRRAAKKRPKCPKGQVAYCDNFCMRGKLEKRRWTCVDSWVFRDILRFR